MMVLHGLRHLHKLLREANRTVTIFPYNVRQVKFTVLFSAVALPYELSLTARGDNFFLLYHVSERYEVEPDIKDRATYKALASLLKLNGSSDHILKPFQFLLELDKHMKQLTSVTREPSPAEILQARPDLPERDRPYFWRWHPSGKVSTENVAKTRLMLGETAAQHSLRIHVSSQWTDDYKKARKWDIS